MDEIEDIRKRARGGEPIASIARAVGASEPTVRKYARMEDLSPEPPEAARARRRAASARGLPLRYVQGRLAGGLLALGAVARLGGLLGRAPPGLVLAIPANRLREAGGEVGMGRLPAQLAAELGAVDGVAAVVAGTVAHPVEVVLRAAEGLEDLAQHGDVVQLAVGADQVGLADRTLGQDGPDGAGVVLGVDPVADVAAVPVELRPDPVDEVRHLPRDELLHVLVGPVVVGTVGDGGAQAERPHPGAHEHVGGRLGGAVGGARAVGGLLGEAGGVAQRQVAVDLVGGDVVVAHAVPAARLEERVGALDVGAQKRARVGDGVVVVGLRGVVHHGVGVGHEPVHERGVADVADHQLHVVGGQPGDVLGVAGVGELVQHGHAHAGVLADDVVDEVAPDEAAAAGDDYAAGLEDVSHVILLPRSQTPNAIIASIPRENPYSSRHTVPPTCGKRHRPKRQRSPTEQPPIETP